MGVHHISDLLHHKPIQALPEQEMAEIAMFSRSPARFLSDRTLLAKAAAELLADAKQTSP
ncbi:MAG: hypothetical protein ABL974_02715 [Prosthecobacter sp.]